RNGISPLFRENPILLLSRKNIYIYNSKKEKKDVDAGAQPLQCLNMPEARRPPVREEETPVSIKKIKKSPIDQISREPLSKLQIANLPSEGKRFHSTGR